MSWTNWWNRLRDLFLPRDAFDWAARLLVWCGSLFLAYSSVKYMAGIPLNPLIDLAVILAAAAPIFTLVILVYRGTYIDLAEMTDNAMTDALTGLMNRRGFETAIAEEGDGAVLIVDIDHFKFINDRYGHAAGDEVLRAMTGHLLAHTRKGDTIARVGGEEFAIFAKDCDSLTIDAIGERLCQGFVLYNKCVPAPIKVTMSAGAAYSLMSRDPQELLRNADQALYQAKRSGRAQLAFWAPPVVSRH